VEDQQPDSGDLTTGAWTDTETPADPSATPPRRRGIFRRRRTRAADSTSGVPETPAEESAEAPVTDAPKMPVGKAARAPRATTVDAEPESAPEADADAEPDVATEPDAESEAGAETQPEAEPEAAEPEPPAPVVLVPHRPAGTRLIAAAVVAGVLFVGGSAFAGAMVQPYLAQRALDTTKIEIARTATAGITALWTYTPDDMSTLPERAGRFLGGDFANDYRKYIDAIVESNKQAQITNTTEVVGAAVESVTPAHVPTEATALVYTNSVATSPVTKNIPSLRYLAYRLTMKRDGGDWLITRMSTITSFDLTPQL
jgi:Mce-associated membrane protein